MSPMRLIILLVAAGAAIGAVFVVRSMQQPAPAVADAAPEAIEVKREDAPARQVLVANRAIPAGKFVVAEDLRWQPWPEGAPAAGYIELKSKPEALEAMVGAVARYPVVQGEPVSETKLVQPGEQSFMAAMLTPGMRATTIEIAPETAAGGFIQPNDRVDVLVTREIQDVTGGANTIQNFRSETILQNVRVLAIDGIYAPQDDEQGAVLIGSRATLELSDRDTTLISAAKKAGELGLALRSIADIQAPQGATPIGRIYRDGMTDSSEGVRIYRYGTESVSSATAG